MRKENLDGLKNKTYKVAILIVFVIFFIGMIFIFHLRSNSKVEKVNAINHNTTIIIRTNNNTNNSTKIDFKKRFNDVLNNKKRIDIGKSFLNEVINENDRMKFYDLYIKLAKAKGYVVTSYIDYIKKYKNTSQPVLILRHDIDIMSAGTKMMFNIEKCNHVKATYYFRWKTFDKALIKAINKSGFEVGLHYETIATYCKNNHIREIKQVDINKCRKILKEEIKKFKKKSGINIKTISSHGDLVNKKINMANNLLLKGQKYSDYGIVNEAYDHDIIHNHIKSYICDNDLLKKCGFAYKANPIDSIMNGKQVIEFLTHPNHWYYTISERKKMLLQLNKLRIIGIFSTDITRK